MPLPNESKCLTQKFDVKVDEQHGARMNRQMDNVTKTIHPSMSGDKNWDTLDNHPNIEQFVVFFSMQ